MRFFNHACEINLVCVIVVGQNEGQESKNEFEMSVILYTMNCTIIVILPWMCMYTCVCLCLQIGGTGS